MTNCLKRNLVKRWLRSRRLYSAASSMVADSDWNLGPGSLARNVLALAVHPQNMATIQTEIGCYGLTPEGLVPLLRPLENDQEFVGTGQGQKDVGGGD